MKNFKPSELPVGTTIDDKTEGCWTKESDLRWEPHIFHCVDCLEDDVIDDATADEKFKDFEIATLPMAVVEYIVEEFAQATGSEIVLDEAIEEICKRQHALKLWDEA